MKYITPEVKTLGGDVTSKGSWFYVETILYGIGYAVLTVFVMQIDVTP